MPRIIFPGLGSSGGSGSSWAYSKEITVPASMVSGTAALTNYPLLVSITDSDLASYANSGGTDIAFFDGSQQLKHKIDSYTAATGALEALVEIPSLPAGGTAIKMVFGNNGLASEGMEFDALNARFGFDDDVNGAWKDGTAYGNASIDTATKKFGAGSLALDGTGDWVIALDAPSLSSDFSIVADFKLTANSTSIIWSLYDGTAITAHVYVDATSVHFLTTDGTASSISSTFNTGTWYQILVVRSGTTVTCYKDGVSIGTFTNGSMELNGDILIGADPGGTPYPANGWIDEFRIYEQAITADYQTTVDNNFTATLTIGSLTDESVTVVTGAMVEISKVELTSAATNIDFTGLSINSAGTYVMTLDWVEGASAGNAASLYINGDTTAGNYTSQFFGASGSSVIASNASGAKTAYALTDSRAQYTIDISTAGGYAIWRSRGGYGSTSVAEANYSVSYSTGISDITQLTLVSDQTGGFGSGTVVRLYKIME